MCLEVWEALLMLLRMFQNDLPDDVHLANSSFLPKKEVKTFF